MCNCRQKQDLKVSKVAESVELSSKTGLGGSKGSRKYLTVIENRMRMTSFNEIYVIFKKINVQFIGNEVFKEKIMIIQEAREHFITNI